MDIVNKVKRGLQCVRHGECVDFECPYFETDELGYSGCSDLTIKSDALKVIEQLQAKQEVVE